MQRFKYDTVQFFRSLHLQPVAAGLQLRIRWDPFCKERILHCSSGGKGEEVGGGGWVWVCACAAGDVMIAVGGTVAWPETRCARVGHRAQPGQIPAHRPSVFLPSSPPSSAVCTDPCSQGPVSVHLSVSVHSLVCALLYGGAYSFRTPCILARCSLPTQKTSAHFVTVGKAPFRGRVQLLYEREIAC